MKYLRVNGEYIACNQDFAIRYEDNHHYLVTDKRKLPIPYSDYEPGKLYPFKENLSHYFCELIDCFLGMYPCESWDSEENKIRNKKCLELSVFEINRWIAIDNDEKRTFKD